jgi:hypothetical protein
VEWQLINTGISQPIDKGSLAYIAWRRSGSDIATVTHRVIRRWFRPDAGNTTLLPVTKSLKRVTGGNPERCPTKCGGFRSASPNTSLAPAMIFGVLVLKKIFIKVDHSARHLATTC